MPVGEAFVEAAEAVRFDRDGLGLHEKRVWVRACVVALECLLKLLLLLWWWCIGESLLLASTIRERRYLHGHEGRLP